MIVRYRNGGRPLTAHLERKIVLAVRGVDPYSAEESDELNGPHGLEIVSATRVEREQLRKAGFAIRDARPSRRAA